MIVSAQLEAGVSSRDASGFSLVAHLGAFKSEGMAKVWQLLVLMAVAQGAGGKPDDILAHLKGTYGCELQRATVVDALATLQEDEIIASSGPEDYEAAKLVPAVSQKLAYAPATPSTPAAGVAAAAAAAAAAAPAAAGGPAAASASSK